MELPRGVDRLGNPSTVLIAQPPDVRSAHHADPRNILNPVLQEIGCAQSLQLDRIANRHHAPPRDGASADAVTRRGAEDEAAGWRQTHRKRGKDDHRAARVLRANLQQEQDADHGELANRERYNDTGQIRERP